MLSHLLGGYVALTIAFNLHPGPPPPPIHTSARSGMRPNGDWEATGDYFESFHRIDNPSGQPIDRSWHFSTSCDESGCRTLMTRTLGDGSTEKAVLTPRGDHYVAYFGPLRITCGPPGLEDRHEGRFRIRWTPDHTALVGRELSVYGGSCEPGYERIAWTAHPSR